MNESVREAFRRVLQNRGEAKPVVAVGYSNFLFLRKDGDPEAAVHYDNMFQGVVKKYNKSHDKAPE
ncbi:MAG: hypothetical protein LBK41_06030 [Clostridiales bacterium]|jgi:hypothetical protein|nr:hypothetical protein [Clostridiales bacterium]